MDGVIMNYRRGKHTQTENQAIAHFHGVDNKEKAQAIIGKTAVWTSPAGKQLTGKVTKEHGRTGSVRILFETGIPGQALGQKVKLH